MNRVATTTALASLFTPISTSDLAPKTAAAPKTNITFATLEPRTPPTAIFGTPLSIASIATASSGSEVPMATTVNPTTRGDTLRLCDILVAP